MPSVGIVGGLGPEATIDYYRRILAAWERQSPGSSPSIVIDSLDVHTGLRLAANDHAALTEYLLASVQRLASAGVDFVAMSANTAHLVFDALEERSPVPLLSIVEVCAAKATAHHYKRLALLGTRFTMEASFYPTVFARHDIEVFPPDQSNREWIHERYVGELLKGDFRERTRSRIVEIVQQMREQHQLDAVILAGTELPLLLQSPTIAGLPVLDTTELHVAAIVDRLG